jgi:SAM-dependent methyltransferase
MATYAKFARFYDQIMGDRTDEIERIREYVKRYMPDAGSLLELGCGTGALLTGLAADMPVTGIDRSAEMLAVAARQATGARLIKSDMTSFSLGTRYDVVICVFDTLNHLPALDSWRELFDRVREHLVEGGLFLFDVNTTGRLRSLCHGPGYLEDFGENTLIMTFTPAGDGVTIWDTRIFEQLGGGLFRLHHEIIPELAVPLATIRETLAPDFELLDERDLDGGSVSDESERVFFAYRRHACPSQPERENARARRTAK